MLQEIKKTVQAFNPGTNQLRMFGVVLAVVFLLWFWLSEDIAVLLGVALALLIAFLTPQWYLPVVKVLIALTYPIGWVLSRLILALLFFLVITPISLMQKVFRADPLSLRDHGEESYWKEVEENEHHDRMSL